jgi:NAD(P)-dependent dehydrogenase (short-subunit alcohol dehydrogenase family)
MPDVNMTFEFPSEGAAIVIGGTGGIGRTICTRLAQAGSNVAFTYRKNEAVAREVEKGIADAGRKAASTVLEVTDAASVEAAFAKFTAAFGKIHAVVYTTSLEIPQQWINKVEAAQMEKALQVNVMGLFNVIQRAIPLLRGGGSFVTVTTSATKRYPRRDVLSAVPKAAVEMLTLAVAKEEGRYGMRANCVGPHMIEAGGGTRVLEQVSAEIVRKMKTDIPLQRFGQPKEVADAVVFLASPLSSFISGQSLIADGAWQV